MKNGSFYLSEEIRADMQTLLERSDNSEYKQCQDKTHSDLEGYVCPACGSKA
jgi:hypothetical protein